MLLSRAGKVKGRTPKQDPVEKKKKKTGRSRKREQFGKLQQTKQNEPEKDEFHILAKMAPPSSPRNVNKKSVEKESPLIEYIGHVPMYIYTTPASFTIPRDQLIVMLQREDEIRRSDEIQDRYTNMRLNWGVADELFDGFAIDKSAQWQVLREFGYDPAVDDSLKAYHISCGQWLNDPQVKESVVWMKYDKFRFGNLQLGDQAPDSELAQLDGSSTTLSAFQRPNRPLIVIGGSYS